MALVKQPVSLLQNSYPMASLYVGDLDPDVSEAILYEKFSQAGPILSLRVCRDKTTRKSLGYAYVNFQKLKDAERALDTMNFDVMKGRAIRIMWSERDSSLRKSGVGNIFIKNLDKSIEQKEFYDTFTVFGNVLSCKIATDETGKSRGYGFVHFETEEAAVAAINKINGMMINGKKIFVGKFIPKNDRNDYINKTTTNVFVKSFGQEENSRRTFARDRPLQLPMGSQAKPALYKTPAVLPNFQPAYMTPAVPPNHFQPAYMTPAVPPNHFQPAYMRPAVPPNHFQPAYMTPAVPPNHFQPTLYMRPAVPQLGPTTQKIYEHQPAMDIRIRTNFPEGAAAIAPNVEFSRTSGPPYMQQDRISRYVCPQVGHLSSQVSITSMLAAVNPQEQKQILGERLYPLVQAMYTKQAGKITNMLLEMDNAELIQMLQSTESLKTKVMEFKALLTGDYGMQSHTLHDRNESETASSSEDEDDDVLYDQHQSNDDNESETTWKSENESQDEDDDVPYDQHQSNDDKEPETASSSDESQDEDDQVLYDQHQSNDNNELEYQKISENEDIELDPPVNFRDESVKHLDKPDSNDNLPVMNDTELKSQRERLHSLVQQSLSSLADYVTDCLIWHYNIGDLLDSKELLTTKMNEIVANVEYLPPKFCNETILNNENEKQLKNMVNQIFLKASSDNFEVNVYKKDSVFNN